MDKFLEIVWFAVLVLNLALAILWVSIASMRPEGVTRGEAYIFEAIVLVGCALYFRIGYKS